MEAQVPATKEETIEMIINKMMSTRRQVALDHKLPAVREALRRLSSNEIDDIWFCQDVSILLGPISTALSMDKKDRIKLLEKLVMGLNHKDLNNLNKLVLDRIDEATLQPWESPRTCDHDKCPMRNYDGIEFKDFSTEHGI